MNGITTVMILIHRYARKNGELSERLPANQRLKFSIYVRRYVSITGQTVKELLIHITRFSNYAD